MKVFTADFFGNATIKQGPDSYENWKAFGQGKPFLSGFEFELYTDAWPTGEIREELGPYQFLNLVSSAVETMANCWRREQAAPLDRLRAAKPDFVKFLEEKYSNLTFGNKDKDDSGTDSSLFITVPSKPFSSMFIQSTFIYADSWSDAGIKDFRATVNSLVL